jgi:hypothetical protein
VADPPGNYTADSIPRRASIRTSVFESAVVFEVRKGLFPAKKHVDTGEMIALH